MGEGFLLAGFALGLVVGIFAAAIFNAIVKDEVEHRLKKQAAPGTCQGPKLFEEDAPANTIEIRNPRHDDTPAVDPRNWLVSGFIVEWLRKHGAKDYQGMIALSDRAEAELWDLDREDEDEDEEGDQP